MPDQAGRGVDRARLQPRRLGVIHVGQHQHRRRMLVEPVRHLFENETDVLEADLLADDEERHGREARVHRAHDPGQHRALADPRVEHPQRRGAWMNVGQFFADPVGDRPFLAAGGDEREVFLAVVVEPEALHRGLGVDRAAPARPGRWCHVWRTTAQDGRTADAAAIGWLMNACTRSRVSVVTRPPKRKPADELAVIDRAATERGLRHAGLATEARYLVEQNAACPRCDSSADDWRRSGLGCKPQSCPLQRWDEKWALAQRRTGLSYEAPLWARRNRCSLE